jgi:hypothetical protein
MWQWRARPAIRGLSDTAKAEATAKLVDAGFGA